MSTSATAFSNHVDSSPSVGVGVVKMPFLSILFCCFSVLSVVAFSMIEADLEMYSGLPAAAVSSSFRWLVNAVVLDRAASIAAVALLLPNTINDR